MQQYVPKLAAAQGQMQSQLGKSTDDAGALARRVRALEQGGGGAGIGAPAGSGVAAPDTEVLAR